MTDQTPQDVHGQESEAGSADDGLRATPDAAQVGIPIGVGIALGAGIGAALGNVAIGIAVGLALGGAIGAVRARQSR